MISTPKANVKAILKLANGSQQTHSLEALSKINLLPGTKLTLVEEATGKPVKAAAALPACADPGPFTYVAAAATAVAKPAEAAGAHSPSTMAVSPPGGKAPAATPTGK